jgi:hypothetical protein
VVNGETSLPKCTQVLWYVGSAQVIRPASCSRRGFEQSFPLFPHRFMRVGSSDAFVGELGRKVQRKDEARDNT